MKRLALAAFIVTFLLSSSGMAQNTIPVQFPKDPSLNTQIGAFTRSGIVYGSLRDLADILKLRSFINEDTRKIEIRTDQYTLKLTADNSFVVIIDKNESANILQLPVSTVFAANSFFVPLDAFVPLLGKILNKEMSYDGRKITMGSAEPVSKYDITGIKFEEKSNGLLVTLKCNRKLSDYECWPKQIGNDTWIYVTLPNVRADADAIRKAPLGGVVKQVLVFQYPTSVQLTIRLKGQVNSTEPMTSDNGTDLLLAIQRSTEEQAAARKQRSYERELQREREKWKLDVVVIDAGHGGDDPGAIGTLRTREKDVTLSIALKLGALIEKNLPDVEVVYTRKTDEFIELYRRGQIANQAGGKLFISIHCNSLPRSKRGENGFEIYLLRPGKTENALRIAERENEVVKLEQDYEKRYQQLTEENFILLTMAQSAYMKYSELFAEILQGEMGKMPEIANNGVKQAGFYVLVGASMPNVLVETAYLSNRHDEKILRSQIGQRRIAESIFNGVKKFKTDYEQTLKEGRTVGTLDE